MKTRCWFFVFYFLLSAALLFAGGTNENGASNSAQPVTITIQVWGGAERFDWQRELFAELYPESASSITVNYLSGGKNDNESLQKFRLSLASGIDIPDILAMNNSSLLEWVREGQVTDLTERVSQANVTLLEGAKALVEYENKIWGIPTQVKSKAWFYRPDLFEEAGIDVKAIKTFDDFIAAGQKMRESLPDTYIINMGKDPAHYWWDSFMLGYDGLKIANEDGTFNITSDKRFAEIFSRIKTIVDSGIALPVEDWSPDWQPAIAEGKIASFLIQSWMAEFLRKFAPDQAGLWEIAPWPEFSRHGGQGGISVIPQASKNKDAAFTFLYSMQLAPEGKIGLWKGNGIAPTTVEGKEELLRIIPSLKESMTAEEWDNSYLNFYGMDVMEKLFRTTEYIRIFEYDPAYGAEKTILRRHLAGYILGSVSLDEALMRAQTDMEQQIGNPYN